MVEFAKRQRAYFEHPNARVDLTGKRYGRIEVLSEAPTDMRGKGRTRWYCRCDCGKVRIFHTKMLTCGDAKSCGHRCPERLGVIGKRFGRLLVIGRTPLYRKKKAHVQCQCDCGAEVIVDVCNLREGHTLSCGCLRNEQCAAVGRLSRTHGMSKAIPGSKRRTPTPIYRTWTSMIDRCLNPKSPAYKDYGGRGITIEDPRWLEFENFYEDMGDRPPGLTLERIFNHRGYCKANCRWATPKEQMLNRRRTLGIIGYDEDMNETRMSMEDMAQFLYISRDTLRNLLTQSGVLPRSCHDKKS